LRMVALYAECAKVSIAYHYRFVWFRKAVVKRLLWWNNYRVAISHFRRAEHAIRVNRRLD